MNYPNLFSSERIIQLLESGLATFERIKASVCLDRSRPRVASHRSNIRVQRDTVRAIVLLGLMLLAWGVIAAVGQVTGLDSTSIYSICLAVGIAINLFTALLIAVEKLPPPAIAQHLSLSYTNPFISNFFSNISGPKTPPPRHTS